MTAFRKGPPARTPAGPREERMVNSEARYPLTVVVPCYNEEKRLEPTLSNTLAYMEAHFPRPFEIVFANDGSTDGTRNLLEEVRKKFPGISMKIVDLEKNQGKGWAVRAGVLAADGGKILVMDADFSIDVKVTPAFLAALDAHEVVIGTKKHQMTQTLESQNPLRKFLGKGFTRLTNIVLGLHCTDITCGFKGFRRDEARDLFERQRLKRWSYDSEILFLAARRGYEIFEIPVTWFHVEGSKVSPFRDVFESLKELLSIPLNRALGRYGRSGPRRKPPVAAP